jgi:hypothetical protein
VWLCSQGGGLRLYRDDVVKISFPDLEWPVALARSEQNRFLVLDRAAGTIIRFEPYGILEARSEPILIDPLALCKDQGWGVWVADPGRGGLVHLDRRLEEIEFLPHDGALGVAWEERNERLWVLGTGGIEVRDASGRVLAGSTIGPRPVEAVFLYDGQQR